MWAMIKDCFRVVVWTSVIATFLGLAGYLADQSGEHDCVERGVALHTEAVWYHNHCYVKGYGR